MESGAWRHTRFDYPPAVPTMISPEEKQYLYWLGATAWSGRGDVVEIGPWLGGSTVCLAAGMKASPHDATGRLHVYDNFLWRTFMAARAPLPIEPGDSFEPYFRENLRDYDEIVNSSARALPDEDIDSDREAGDKRFHEDARVPQLDSFPGESVEIVFIDGAKSWRGMRHLLSVARGHLIPGVSLLVCQDFKYWGTYWVPVMMARLGRWVTPVHNVRGATTVTFRVESEIPVDFVEQLEDHVRDLPVEETLAGIDRAAAWLDAAGDRAGSAGVSLCRVSFLSHHGDPEAAAREFTSIQQRWPLSAGTAGLERARAYLREEKALDIPRSQRVRTAAAAARARRILSRLRGGGR